MNINGIKTATKTTVVAIIANDTCLAPLYAATRGLSPNSILLTINKKQFLKNFFYKYN